MKKKKQQTRNIIVLAVLIVGIILGLWAMNSGFSLNSNAAGAKCLTGIFIKGTDKKCYEVMSVQCGGTKCCNKSVDMSKCKNSKNNNPELECKSQGYSTVPSCPKGTVYRSGINKCYDKNKSENIDPIGISCFSEKGGECQTANGEKYCCNKQVDNKFCGL